MDTRWLRETTERYELISEKGAYYLKRIVIGVVVVGRWRFVDAGVDGGVVELEAHIVEHGL